MLNKKPTIILSAKEARSLTLKVWKYLYKHPEIKAKSDLPPHIKDKIIKLSSQCPLCHYFKMQCSLCPLTKAGESCYHTSSAWSIWLNDEDDGMVYSDEERSNAARRIYRIVRAWKVKVIK